MNIDISKDFSSTPFGRYKTDGKWSAEKFRHELLAPKLKEAIECHDSLTVLMDGLKPGFDYSSSFLEESFGGLVRVEGFELDDVLASIVFETSEDGLVDELQYYIRCAAGK